MWVSNNINPLEMDDLDREYPERFPNARFYDAESVKGPAIESLPAGEYEEIKNPNRNLDLDVTHVVVFGCPCCGEYWAFKKNHLTPRPLNGARKGDIMKEVKFLESIFSKYININSFDDLYVGLSYVRGNRAHDPGPGYQHTIKFINASAKRADVEIKNIQSNRWEEDYILIP